MKNLSTIIGVCSFFLITGTAHAQTQPGYVCYNYGDNGECMQYSYLNNDQGNPYSYYYRYYDTGYPYSYYDYNDRYTQRTNRNRYLYNRYVNRNALPFRNYYGDYEPNRRYYRTDRNYYYQDDRYYNDRPDAYRYYYDRAADEYYYENRYGNIDDDDGDMYIHIRCQGGNCGYFDDWGDW